MSLWQEKLLNEPKDVFRVEYFYFMVIRIFLDILQVKYIIYKTEKKIELRANQAEEFPQFFSQLLTQNLFNKHQWGTYRSAEVVRDRLRQAFKGVISVFFL